jgi:hypothetical protein
VAVKKHCQIVSHTQAGNGPAYLEFDTYRWREHCWFYRILWFSYYNPVKIAFLQHCYNKRYLIFANIVQFCCAIPFFNRLQKTLVAASTR